MKRKILSLGAIAAVLLTGCEREAVTASSGIPEKTPIREYRDVPPVTLVNQEGEEFEMSDLKGKIWIANFIFTSCNAECVVLSHNMSRLQEAYAGDDSVAFVSFSVDPDTDKPERLKKYAEIRKADLTRWNFLTGDAGKMQSLVKDSFLQPAAISPEERAKLEDKTQLLHSKNFAIVDKTGKVRAYVNGMNFDVIEKTREVVETLMAEQ